ncbi:unnamed protein product, partial [Amoebophrya sp. A120]
EEDAQRGITDRDDHVQDEPVQSGAVVIVRERMIPPREEEHEYDLQQHRREHSGRVTEFPSVDDLPPLSDSTTRLPPASHLPPTCFSQAVVSRRNSELPVLPYMRRRTMRHTSLCLARSSFAEVEGGSPVPTLTLARDSLWGITTPSNWGTPCDSMRNRRSGRSSSTSSYLGGRFNPIPPKLQSRKSSGTQNPGLTVAAVPFTQQQNHEQMMPASGPPAGNGGLPAAPATGLLQLPDYSSTCKINTTADDRRLPSNSGVSSPQVTMPAFGAALSRGASDDFPSEQSSALLVLPP